MQLPIGAENDFKGVVDLIEMNALIWRDESSAPQWDVVEIPADLKAERRGVAREDDRGRRRARRRGDSRPTSKATSRTTTRCAG